MSTKNEEIQKETSNNSKSSVESEDQEDVEPVLAYYRMKNGVVDVLNKDFASCMRVNSRILILGTHWGRVYVLDHLGNVIKTYDNHMSTVNEVAINESEEYVASCGDDGKVVIFSLYDETFNQTAQYDRPIKSIAFEPNFVKTKSYVTGDTKLVLNEKGLFGRSKSNVLHEGEGIIRTIRWHGNYIAWSNSKGVKIYATNEKKIITYIKKDHDLREELYRCSLLWIDAITLVVCWGDRLKICKVRSKNSSTSTASNPASSHNLVAMSTNAAASGAGLAAALVGSDKKDTPTFVEIVTMIETNFYICGVAPYENELLLLTYFKKCEEDEDEDRRPVLRIIKPYPDYYEECSVDLINVRDFEKNKCCDYCLDYLKDENTFFIVCPKDIAVAKPRTFDDHIDWLISRQEYEEAFKQSKEHSNELKKHTYFSVGSNYIDHLLHTKQYKDAAEWCSKILKECKNWEEKILIFAKQGQLEEIADYIPFSNPILTAAVYEKVLNEFLMSKNYKFFKYLIKKWPCDIYDLDCITNAALDVQRRDDNKILLETIALLYEYQKLYDKSFVIYITLEDQAVFDLIIKHELYECAFDNIISLIALNKQKSLNVLIENMEKLPVKKVVDQLSKNKLYLHYYLDAVFQKDPSASRDYHTMQVSLYADYEREKLLNFLQESQYVILAQAQQECQQRQLIPEMVYILERMGQIKQALQLILYGIKDVTQAIDFCKRHNDKDLWDDLIKFSLSRADYIIALLNNVGTYVDPKQLIDKIPNSLKIKGLRDALVKILQDYRVQISLLEGSVQIMSKDCLTLMEKQIKYVKKGIRVDEIQLCEICKTRLISNDLKATRKMIIFECKHAYHETCLPSEAADVCAICNENKTSPKIVIK